MPSRNPADTPLGALAEVAGALAETRSRLRKRQILVEFLSELREREVAPAVLLLTGRVLPESEERSPRS